MAIYSDNGWFDFIEKHREGNHIRQLRGGISELLGQRALDENMILILHFVRGTRAGAFISGLTWPSRHFKFQPVGTEAHSCSCNAGILWTAQVVIQLVSGERGVQGFVRLAPGWIWFPYRGDRVSRENGCITKDDIQTTAHGASYGSCYLNDFTSIWLVEVLAGHEL